MAPTAPVFDVRHVRQMPVIIFHHPPNAFEFEGKDFKEVVQKLTSGRQNDNDKPKKRKKMSTDPSVVIAEAPTDDPATNEVYSALQSTIPNNFRLETPATNQPVHELSDPIPAHEISAIPSPGTSLSDNAVLNNTNDDLMSYHPAANDVYSSLQSTIPNNFTVESPATNQPVHELSDPIPTDDISAIPSPWMSFSDDDVVSMDEFLR